MAFPSLQMLAMFVAINLVMLLAAAGGGAFGASIESDAILTATPKPAAASTETSKQDTSGGGSPQPDLWIGFINWPGMNQFKPVLQPLQGTVGQVTGPLTIQILTNLPLAQQLYDQYNNMGAQLSNTLGSISSFNGVGNLPVLGSLASDGSEASKKSGNNGAEQAKEIA